MTLRETIDRIVYSMCEDNELSGQATDAIFTAIHEHVTSLEAVERANQSFWTNQPSIMRAAILAALEEE